MRIERKNMKNKAVFLDRDGTINVDRDYIYKISDFEFIFGVPEALKLLQNAGYKLIIITNQSGIARGYYTEHDYEILNNWMINTLLDTFGVEILASYYCPHLPLSSPDENVEEGMEKYRKNCNCRKPKLGLFERAIQDFDIDIGHSYAIGDKLRDLAICESQDSSMLYKGVKGFLINTRESEEVIDSVKRGEHKNIAYEKDLLSAAGRIVTPQHIAH